MTLVVVPMTPRTHKVSTEWVMWTYELGKDLQAYEAVGNSQHLRGLDTLQMIKKRLSAGEEGGTLICSVCQFLWCKLSQYGQWPSN